MKDQNDKATLYEQYKVAPYMNTYVGAMKDNLDLISEDSDCAERSICSLLGMRLLFGSTPIDLDCNKSYVEEEKTDIEGNKEIKRNYYENGERYIIIETESVKIDAKGNLIEYLFADIHDRNVSIAITENMVGVKIRVDNSSIDYDFTPIRYYTAIQSTNAIISQNENANELEIEMNYNDYSSMTDEYGGSKGMDYDYNNKKVVRIPKPADFVFKNETNSFNSQKKEAKKTIRGKVLNIIKQSIFDK